MTSKAPAALSYWFIVHFIIDMMVAIPLFFFPERALEMAGWDTIDPFMARIVAAAFFGIGIESLIGRNATLHGFRDMLNLKLIWSFTAIIGIGWAMIEGSQGRPVIGWMALATFIGFHIVWWYWRIRIGKLLNGSRSSDG